MAVETPGPAGLAAYAASAAQSRGRVYEEPADAARAPYQRDCDRIIHAAAYRCLEYKTQVMVNHADGFFRTRLTHSMEVAKLARALARALRLNEDLAEAVALAHDLGHTPFGHVGQDVLDECMRGHGGFEHNVQSLRVIDRLEHKYAAFPGLNLCFETREGVLKRCPRELVRFFGPVAERFRRGWQPSLEAQLVDLADRIAYTNHDLDDGLGLEMLALEDARGLELFERAYREARALGPELPRHSLLHEINRRMIHGMMQDLTAATRARLAAARPASLQEVREQPAPLAGFSAEMRAALKPVTRFLNERYYRHARLLEMAAQAKKVIRELFQALMERPEELPERLAARRRDKEEKYGVDGRARVIADYIAGLSDRHILEVHGRLCGGAG